MRRWIVGGFVLAAGLVVGALAGALSVAAAARQLHHAIEDAHRHCGGPEDDEAPATR